MEIPKGNIHSSFDEVLEAFDVVASHVDEMVVQDTRHMSPEEQAVALAEIRLRLFESYFPNDSTNPTK